MKKVLLASLLIATFGSAAYAGVVLSDTFTYPDGALVGPGSLWANHSGTPGSLVVSNNTLVIIYTNSEDAHIDLQGVPYLSSDSSAKLYSSYTISITDRLPGIAGDYISHFKGTNGGALSDFGARVFVSRTNTVTQLPVADGKFRIAIANGASSATNSYWGQIDQDLSTNTTYTVVTRFVPSTGLATIWVNPASESDPGATATDPGTLTRSNQFDVYSYAFRQGGNSSSPGAEGNVYVDNLKIGTFFADVAGSNTSPTITSISKQAIPKNGSTGPISFTVNDAETPNSLTCTASSSNPTLIPNNPANLTLTGSGANRFITVTPAAGLQGQSVITVNVSDSVNSSFTTFLVTVGAPTVSPIPNQRAYTNTSIPAISFTVNDPESDPITLYGSSSDESVLQSANIVFGGSGASRTVTLNPEPGVVGLTTVSIDVTDTHSTNTVTFTLTVSPILGILFSDNFAYTTFPPNIGNPLYGADGSPWLHASGTPYDVQVTNPLVYLSYTNAEVVAGPLTNDPPGTTYAASDAVIFYTGCTVKLSLLPLGAGNYFLLFRGVYNDALSSRCRVFALTNGAGGGSFRLGISINQPVSTAVYPLDLNLGTTYAVVTRYNSKTSESTLWVNPITESSTSVDATDAHSTSEVGAVALRSDSGMGNIALGQLKVGTKFSDALPSIAPTPEALQVALFGGKVVLSWNNPAFLLASNNIVTGTYVKIPGATSPYTNTPAGRNFFRLVYP